MSLVFSVLSHMPAWMLRGLLRLAARLLFLFGLRRKIALENIAAAFPEWSPAQVKDLALRNYLHIATCACDFLRSPNMTDEELFSLVDPQGWDTIGNFSYAGKPVIGCTAHLGAFELFGVYGARRKLPLTILTRTLKGGANASWVGTRAMAGIKEIHKGMENLVESLKRNETLAILIDQNMQPRRAIFVPFFGRLAATTPAPAVLAERTGAPIVLCLLLRKPDGTYRNVMEGPFYFERKSEDRQADIRAFTTMINERFEHHVREHPEQWFWLHRRWKSRPPEETATASPEQREAAS